VQAKALNERLDAAAARMAAALGGGS